MDKQFTRGQRVIWERNGFKAEARFIAVCGNGTCAEVETLKGWDIAPLSQLTPAESLPVQRGPVPSVFLQNLHYFFAQTDGTYKWPDGSIGDLLKQAKREIENPPAQPVQVPEDCDVRKILLRVSPGDGSGHEEYAKNTREVVDVLTDLAERLDAALLAASQPMDNAPVFVVDHVGTSYGEGPNEQTVIVGHSANLRALVKGAKLHVSSQPCECAIDPRAGMLAGDALGAGF